MTEGRKLIGADSEAALAALAALRDRAMVRGKSFARTLVDGIAERCGYADAGYPFGKDLDGLVKWIKDGHATEWRR